MEVDNSSGPLHFLCTRCSIPRGIARLVPDPADQVCVYCADGTTGHDSSTELIFCFSQFHEATQDSFGGMFDTKKKAWSAESITAATAFLSRALNGRLPK
jgi:hypothetical protein